MANAPLVIDDLLKLAATADFLWTPLRPSVDIHRLYEVEGGASAALLRYAPGGTVPHHRHQGYEHIFVLSGSQRDERGVHGAGSLVINPPGTEHTVESPEGCLVLAVWERAVSFV